MSFIINIRFNSHRTVPIEVEPWWVLKRLKSEIEKVHKVPADDIRVIFQGRELNDSVSIQECDLSDFSVLHVVRGGRRARRRSQPAESPGAHGHPARLGLSLDVKTTCQGLNEISEVCPHDDGACASSIPAVYRPQFFVYCKNHCGEIRPGKLRVRCTKCKQGTLTLDKDPDEWEDVLEAGRLTGTCQAEDCDGKNAEFYFKCSSHQSGDDDTAVALDRVRSNTRDVPCITCMDIENPVLVFPCENTHAMCLDCFRLYCETKLNDRAFTQSADVGYTLGCPAGCPDSLIQEAHHFRVLGSDQYDRYQRFGTEECLLQMGGVLCPGRGCGTGLLPEEGVRQIICVQGCGMMFCRDCLEPFHSGECETRNDEADGNTDGYRVDPRNAERARWDIDSKEMIRKTTKPCPQCRVPVEKDGGCMHMYCPRCQFEWCWQCSTRWNRECQSDHWFG